MANATKSKPVQSQVSVTSNEPAVIKPAGNAIPGGDIADTLMDLAGGNIVKPTSKSKTPVISIPKPIEQLVEKYIEALKDKKNAAARVDDFFSQMAPHLEKSHYDYCLASKSYSASIKLSDKLIYKFGGKYKKITADKKATLTQMFADSFPAFFTSVNEVSVKAESLDQEMIADLKAICEKRGKKFTDLFTVESVLKPTEAYTRQRFTDKEVKALAIQAAEEELVVPYKSSLEE